MPECNKIAEIAYHDYFLLLAQMDSEWSRRCKKETSFPSSENHEQFRKNCIYYGEGINANYRDWYKANHDGEAEGGVKEPADGFVEPFLYNPMSFFPLGHADDACIVLLDDQSPTHHLTMRLNRRVEDVSLAFCLDMQKLIDGAFAKKKEKGVRENEDDLRQLAETIFREPHTLFQEDLGPRAVASKAEVGKSYENMLKGKEQLWINHEIQKKSPFVVFTKYRMDGITSVTHFLLAQQVCYETMASRILETVHALKERAEKFPSDSLKLDDIEKTRICLLDLNGAEEIGSLVFCNNLTIAMTIVAELRKLTYHDAFEHDQRLREYLRNNPVLQKIVHQYRKKSSPQQCIEFLEMTHLLRWTTSSVFASPCMLGKGGEKVGCSGLANGEIRVQLSSGHRKYVDNVISPKTDIATQKLDDDWEAWPIGEDDLIIPIVQKGETDASADRWLPMSEIFQCWHNYALDHIKKANVNNQFTGRHIVEMLLDLEVPVCRNLLADHQKAATNEPHLEHHAALLDTLIKVQKKLCPSLTPTIRLAEKSSDQLPLNMRDLYYWQRRVGLPVKIGQTIESLYQMFFAILADSYRFDLVLDLYDVLAGLHHLITRSLADESEKKGKLPAPHILDMHRVREIETLVSAIQNALQHRIAKVFPISNSLDMAIDFRGGLNQMVLGAAAPMLSGVGLFRRCVIEPELYQRLKEDPNIKAEDLPRPRAMVGVVSHISLLSGIECRPLQLGFADDLLPHLAHYEADVPHILDIPSYADNFHEAGHLVFDTLFRQEVPVGFRVPHRNASDAQEEMSSEASIPPKKSVEESWKTLEPLWTLRKSNDADERARFKFKKSVLSEIFAVYFGHVFVFGSERAVALHYYAMAFCRSLDSIGIDPGYDFDVPGVENQDQRQAQVYIDTMDRFIDVVVRLSLVQMLLPSTSAAELGSEWLDQMPDLPTTEEAVEYFSNTLEEVKHYHPSFEAFWKKGDGETRYKNFSRIAKKKFQYTYDLLKSYLPWVYEVVAEIYRRDYQGSNLPIDNDESQEIDRVINQSFEEGQPILRCFLPLGNGKSNIEEQDIALWQEPEDPFLNTRYLISRILYNYLKRLPSAGEDRVVLYREPSGRAVDFNPDKNEEPDEEKDPDRKDKRKWSDFQIDPGSAPLFCPVPEERRKRTKAQIVIRKVFRDIAATFHGRRLYRIIADTLSSEE